MTKKKEQEINNSSSDIVFLQIGQMKLAPEYNEIFEAFNRKHCFVNKIMSSDPLDEKYPLIVRKTKEEPFLSVLKTLCKRVILETAVRQPVFKNDGELIHRPAPVGNRHCPSSADISQG